MNLLNKKLKEKLKTLDDIDKQYIINVKNKKSHTSKNCEPNNSMNSIDIIKRTVNEKFDKIYSDFILNENSYYHHEGGNYKKNYSMNKTNLDKDPTNEDSIAKDNNNDSDLENNIEKDMYFQYQNNSEMEVGQRLYNYGIFLKNKLENQRQREENRIKLLMRPKISARSKSNIRNPDKISERLFQNYKKNIVKKNKNNTNNINRSNNDTNFSFHPKINKKSLLIANNLEPSFIRLNKKKKIKNNSLFNNKEVKDMKHDIFSFNYKNNNNSKKDKKKDNRNIFEKMNNLYLKGVEEKKKKEKIYNDNQRKKDDEYKQFTFKPNINTFKKKEHGNKKKNNSKKEENSIYNMYKKQFEWKKKIENKNIKKKEKNEEAKYKLCTFKPEITQHNYKNNDKNLSKVLAEMNEYVEKRRKNIRYKKIEEMYKNKRLGGGGSEYIIKATIPQEFELETDTRNKNLDKNKNRSCDNFHINKNNLLIEQNSDKKSINNENEKNYWFFKDETNNSNNNNTKVSNKNNETKSQMDFFEAVNLLHDKLGKFNI